MIPSSLHPPPKPPNAGERILARTCGHCGARFQPVRPHQRFDKPSCRIAFFKSKLPLLDAEGNGLRRDGGFE